MPRIFQVPSILQVKDIESLKNSQRAPRPPQKITFEDNPVNHRMKVAGFFYAFRAGDKNALAHWCANVLPNGIGVINTTAFN